MHMHGHIRLTARMQHIRTSSKLENIIFTLLCIYTAQLLKLSLPEIKINFCAFPSINYTVKNAVLSLHSA